MSEFDLIRRHFTRPTPGALLGVGDDAALLQVGSGRVLAVSSDMLVCGTHFFADADPRLLGHKTLAVNLSDLAAMGAVPRWATLALALPSADEAWLEQFSAGFFALASVYGVELVGGDTTRGPLNLCVTIMGEVDATQALRRSGAQPGDEIWVSGKLGDAALAQAHLQGHVALSADEFAACAPALHQPQPRVALGLALCGIANSAIDICWPILRIYSMHRKWVRSLICRPYRYRQSCKSTLTGRLGFSVCCQAATIMNCVSPCLFHVMRMCCASANSWTCH
jgi:thiamine-monophosphate kinase